MKKIYINNYTKAVVIVSPAYVADYQSSTEFTFLFEGNKKGCLEFIEKYWDDNYVVDEERIFMEE